MLILPWSRIFHSLSLLTPAQHLLRYSMNICSKNARHFYQRKTILCGLFQTLIKLESVEKAAAITLWRMTNNLHSLHWKRLFTKQTLFSTDTMPRTSENYRGSRIVQVNSIFARGYGDLNCQVAE